MRLYLMRHGEAVPAGTRHEDGDRPLTSKGRQAVLQSVGAWARREEPPPQVWLVSPLVRAVQTCEIAAAAFHPTTPVEVSRALVPEGRISVVADILEGRREDSVAVVGHQPLLGGLAAFLLGWGTVPADLEAGAILALDLPEKGPGRIIWHALPARDERGPLFLSPPEE